MPVYSLVGRRDMENAKTMIKHGGIAGVAPPLGLLNRRSFLFASAASLGALGLSGCAMDNLADAEKMYGPVADEKFPIPAVDISKVDPKYFRQTVKYDSSEAVGTII